MIILDTNVISEPLKPEMSTSVRKWLNQQPKRILHTTSINIAEILFGVELLPNGKRKDKLRGELTQELLPQLFGDRILSFDSASAIRYALIAANAKRDGVSLPIRDGQIAAIALANDCTVATRDVLPFTTAGVKVINPWALQ